MSSLVRGEEKESGRGGERGRERRVEGGGGDGRRVEKNHLRMWGGTIVPPPCTLKHYPP